MKGRRKSKQARLKDKNNCRNRSIDKKSGRKSKNRWGWMLSIALRKSFKKDKPKNMKWEPALTTLKLLLKIVAKWIKTKLRRRSKKMSLKRLYLIKMLKGKMRKWRWEPNLNGSCFRPLFLKFMKLKIVIYWKKHNSYTMNRT